MILPIVADFDFGSDGSGGAYGGAWRHDGRTVPIPQE